MATKTRVKFNAKKYGKDVMKLVVEEQTRRLVAYAQEEIVAMVETKEFSNRTANAQDSYVWAVYYNGKKENHGFYDPKTATSPSYLHEWSKDKRERVNGRQAANAFLREYKPTTTNGWEIVFCAAAPYLGYLDGAGFFHRTKSVVYHFNVMSQRYNHIKAVLEPKCKVTFKVNPPQY